MIKISQSKFSNFHLALSLLVASLGIISCHEDSAANLLLKSPKVTIIGESELIIPEFGRPTKEVTVKNTGKGPTAFNVRAFISLRRGNHIVDESGIFVGTLAEGESRTKEITLIDLKKGDDYDTQILSLEWEDAEGAFYSK